MGPISRGFREEPHIRTVLREEPGLLQSPTHMGVIHRNLLGTQIRAARALLRWSAPDLARASALGINTIRRAEAAENETALTAANELAIRRALEGAGVVFINETGGGPGVRLRGPAPRPSGKDA